MTGLFFVNKKEVYELAVYSYWYGVIQIANVFLAVVAGVLAASLFRVSHQKMHLKPWKMLIVALVLFSILEVVGALRTFGVYESLFLTHTITSAILAFLIITLVLQIKIAEE